MSTAYSPELAEKMAAPVAHLRGELGGLRGGRATPGLVEPIKVNAYGDRLPLNQLANISVPEPRLIVVSVWDRALVNAVEKGILEANLGLNPQTEGTTVRLRLPEMTEERRKELFKAAGGYAEAARVAVRNLRRHANEEVRKMEKDGKLSQDDARREQEQIQKITETKISEINDILALHGKELLGS